MGALHLARQPLRAMHCRALQLMLDDYCTRTAYSYLEEQSSRVIPCSDKERHSKQPPKHVAAVDLGVGVTHQHHLVALSAQFPMDRSRASCYKSRPCPAVALVLPTF